jgi:hypothetical protein
METPLFNHDCERCKFLGTFKGTDLYFCNKSWRITLISRYSSDGPDYTSGMFLVGHDEHITEANKRAFSAGLLGKTNWVLVKD